MVIQVKPKELSVHDRLIDIEGIFHEQLDILCEWHPRIAENEVVRSEVRKQAELLLLALQLKMSMINWRSDYPFLVVWPGCVDAPNSDRWSEAYHLNYSEADLPNTSCTIYHTLRQLNIPKMPTSLYAILNVDNGMNKRHLTPLEAIKSFHRSHRYPCNVDHGCTMAMLTPDLLDKCVEETPDGAELLYHMDMTGSAFRSGTHTFTPVILKSPRDEEMRVELFGRPSAPYKSHGCSSYDFIVRID